MKKTFPMGLWLTLLLLIPLLTYAQQTKLAAWNFNNTYTTVTNTAGDSTFYTPTTTAQLSSATVTFSNSKFKVYPDSAVSAIQNYAFNEVSTTLQQRSGYNNMVAKLQYTGPCTYSVYTDGTLHKNYFQLIFPTIGYDNINMVFSFAGGQNSTADFTRVVYSTDGGATWLDAGTSYAAQSGWWLYKAYTATIAARNKSQVIVRILTNTASTSSSAYFNLDFCRLYGTVYVPSTTPTHKVTTTISPTGAGGISISPAGTEFDEGTNVTLTSTSRSFGYQFKQWQDSKGNALSTASAYTFKLMKDTSIVALYQPITTYNFTLNKIGCQWGQVTLSPAPTNGKYEAGTTVTMTVVPNGVSNFNFWDDKTTTLSRTVVVNKDTTFSATFDEIPFIAGWDFRVDTPKSLRPGDYYSNASNKGLFNMYNQDGTSTSWLSNTGAFSPSLSCAYLWTAGASFATNRRYFQASFSTIGYHNIKVNSQMAASYQHYLTQKMQVSTDSVNFTTVKTLNVSTTTWSNFNDTLPASYENQNRIYVRWVGDATSTLVGNSTDADGTAITNVFVYADLLPTNDVTPPTLVSSVPAGSSTGASINGSVVLVFSERVKAGTGNCTLASKTLTPTFGSLTVTLPYTKLSYSTNYTFTVPAGAFTDMAGNSYAGLTLNFRTMDRPAPTPKQFDAVVAKDGSGNYTTIQAAIDAAPAGRAIPWLIYVKNGRYKGHVDVPVTKPFINLIGQNRDSVIITDARLCGKSTVFPDSVVYAVDPGATVVVKSTDCYFENICFENQFGYETVSGPQALALYTLNDRVILNNCWLRSYQDTYLTAYNSASARHYVKNCRIEGAVDFIYGSGNVFFDQCLIYCTRPSGGYIVAPGHISGTPWGYVFDHCTIDGTSASYTTYLGRPWVNSPMASFFNTTFKIGIYPEGWWYKMGAIPTIFADYKSVDASGNLVDLSQRISQYQYDVKDANGVVISTVTGTAKNSFTDAEAANYSYDNVTSGSDGWDPKAQIIPTSAPANLKKVSDGLTWDATPYAICYVVEKNGKVIGFPTTNAYTDAAYSSTATYKVTAVSEFGALSVSAIASNGTTTQDIVPGLNKVYAYTVDRTLVVKNVTPGAQVSVYGITGILLAKKTATATSVAFDFVSSCIVKVVTGNNNSVIKVIK
jgi:pectin methylesterase-like acyl-CoA thioesterase